MSGISASGGKAWDFESAEIQIASGLNSVAHGLGVVPKLWDVVIRNKVGEWGYSPGDEISVKTTNYVNGTWVSTAFADSGVIGITTGSTYRIGIQDKGSGVGSWHQITNANWVFVMRAKK